MRTEQSASTSSASISAAAPSPSAVAWSSSHAAHYTPLSFAQRTLLFAGSSVLALLDPHRADLVAAVGEVAPGTEHALRALKRTMQASEDGRWILDHKPRIDSTTFNLPAMRATYDPHSFGYAYAKFMTDRKYAPDERTHVKSAEWRQWVGV
jgi:ubiquinone biosynthesis protein COQ4